MLKICLTLLLLSITACKEVSNPDSATPDTSTQSGAGGGVIVDTEPPWIADLDPTGWTVLEPSIDSLLVYVSSSTGNDANSGLSATSPKKTLAAGHALLRNANPDWLLLKRGDVWNGESLDWKKSGNGPLRKTVLASYGEGARPMIRNGQFQYGEAAALNHFAIVGIDFYASINDPSSSDFQSGSVPTTGIQILADSANDLLVEDNRVRFYQTNIQIRRVGGGSRLITNVSVRRNISADAAAFGILLTWLEYSLLEENTFERCGWARRSKFLHDAYVKENRSFTARGNIFSRGGNMGLKFSADNLEASTDFVIEDNLFYLSALGIGHSSGPTGFDPTIRVSHRNGRVNRNIFLSPGKTLPYNSTETQTLASLIASVENLELDSNIFIHNDQYQDTGQAFGFSREERVANVTVSNNKIFNWLSNTFNSTGSHMKNWDTVDGLTQINNFPTGVTYPDPGRNLATYNSSLGGSASGEAFLLRSTQLSRTNWDSRYTAKKFNNYIRAGFGVAEP